MTDVLILGGGLAGLTLALQLKQTCASLAITILERRAHPVPLAAHKVGESSVEIGAHYFEEVLGLREHLKTEQIRKFGFRFFFSDGERDLSQVTELGASMALPVASYQIDRGLFENFLAKEAIAKGIDFIDAAMISAIDVDSKTIRYRHTEGEHSISSKWLVDASGRAGLLKRKLGLAKENNHKANAVWFRIKGKIAIDEWVDCPVWRGRCSPPERWRSTNHLCGKGYWVWLIPLASGAHSVGIVADANTHPLASMNTFERAMDWLAVHQPRLFDDLDTRREDLLDFAFFKHFSYSATKVWDADNRWALSGEAGVFLDPFYSPGSDFIAIGNTFICDLITRDFAGESYGLYGPIYERMFFSFYESTLSLYENQYDLFGDPEVMPVKVLWDYTYYWGLLAPLVMHNKLTDLGFLSRHMKEFEQAKSLNFAMQSFLKAWSNKSDKANPQVMIDQRKLPWFVALNQSLQTTFAEPQLHQLFSDNAALLNRLAMQILSRAEDAVMGLDGAELAAHINILTSGEQLLPTPQGALELNLAR